MKDFKKFIENDAYTYIADSFGPFPDEQVGGTREDPVRVKTGVFLQENGDVFFKLFYPTADTVSIQMSSGHSHKDIDLEKREGGFFEGTFEYTGDEKFIGKRNFSVVVDGLKTVNPRLPYFFRGGKITNYVDIPDPAWDDYLIKDVPHGSVAYELYWSNVTESWQRCMVYTPAEYRHGSESYPVLYLHHGWGENETAWMFNAKTPMILDNLIAEGEAVPFIVVTNANSPKLPSDGSHGMAGYSRVLLEDCIPYIEREYRVKTDKWSRAIGGISYGCMITSYIGFAHPELFGSLGLMSGGIRCKDFWKTYEENHQLDWLYNNADEVARQYKLIYRCHGTKEFYDSPDHAEDEKFLKQNGIFDLPIFQREWFWGGCHEWDTFGKDIAGFSKYLFRE